MTFTTKHSKLGGIVRTTAETKAETTKRISQEIVQAEDERRRHKTEKLKAERLALQATSKALEAAGARKTRAKKSLKASHKK